MQNHTMETILPSTFKLYNLHFFSQVIFEKKKTGFHIMQSHFHKVPVVLYK